MTFDINVKVKSKLVSSQKGFLGLEKTLFMVFNIYILKLMINSKKSFQFKIKFKKIPNNKSKHLEDTLIVKNAFMAAVHFCSAMSKKALIGTI
ncbi:hypothetical protein BpHYR1_047310 [Brachionus plicatilis]|uniref:Uncharacterized protein n=1 Tax=Brachionus plicatilis TaxID=10195 RepID=A0A3M7TAL6_BRAPC|nr:hypothetical protein BpHYR1_047310 [Brachionus plicatilis]